MEATGFLDAQIAHVAHKVGPVVVDRLVDEAIARFMPATAEEARRQGADRRCFVVGHRQVSFAGTSRVYGELDLADALDLDLTVGQTSDASRPVGRVENTGDLVTAEQIRTWCGNPGSPSR